MYNVSDNVKWLATQYRETNIQTLLKRIGEIQQTYQVDVLVLMNTLLSIDTATGVWLDYIGYRLGVLSRPTIPVDVTNDQYFGFSGAGTGFNQAPFYPSESGYSALSDYYFRRFLKAKAAQITTNCSTESIRNALLNFFDEVFVQDNQNMSMTISLTTTISSTIVEAVIDAGIIIKPAGVKIKVIVNFGEYFGFNGAGEGFNQAPFAHIINI